MIDLVILAALAFLIARVIWNILTTLENIFLSKKQSQQTYSTEPPQSQKKQVKLNSQPYKQKSSSSAIFDKNQISSSKESGFLPRNSAREVNIQDKNIKTSKQQVLEKRKSQQQAHKLQTALEKQIKDKEALRQKQQVFPVWLEKQEGSEDKEDYPAVISRLEQEIQNYKRQKQIYVQRIEEIIQHVMNENEGELEEESRNSTEDEQLHAINNLKHQLNSVNAKINQQKEQLNLKFQKEQQQLKRYYQEQHRSNEKNFNIKVQQYQQTINEVSRRIYQMEKQKLPHSENASDLQLFQQKEYQLQLKLNEQVLQLRQANNKIEQMSREVQELKQLNLALSNNISEKQVKIQKAKYECDLLLGSIEKFSKQNEKLKFELEHQSKNTLNHQNKSIVQSHQSQQGAKQKKQLTREKQQLAIQLQSTKKQLRIVKEQLGRVQNDQIDLKTRFEAQVGSLQFQIREFNNVLQSQRQKYFKLEEELEQAKSKLQQQRDQGQKTVAQSAKHQEEISKLKASIRQYISQKDQCQKRLLQTQEELKFCQEQIKNSKETQAELREKLVQAISSPNKSERSYATKEDVFRHPEYLILKRKVEQYEGSRMSPSSPEVLERVSAIIPDSLNGQHKREVSPSFPQLNIPTNRRDQTSPISEDRNMYKTTGTYQLPKPSNNFVSTIYAGRSNTPAEKPVAFSSVMEGGILGQIYLGETQLLNEEQRNFVMHEVSSLKKISAKKTRLVYSLRQKVNKPFIEYVLGVPNIIILAQLQNKKIVGGFTQNAFSKDNKFIKSSVYSKAIIFDVTNKAFIPNEGKGEVIHYEENNLVWGKNQFVIHCFEPIALSVNLNCEGAVYPSTYTSKEFINSEQKTIKISKFEAHRVYLG